MHFPVLLSVLLRQSVLEEVFARLIRQTSPAAVVNNLYSSDWAVFNHASTIESIM